MATSKYKKTTQGSSVIPNNYAGKSAAKIWNDWSKEQRKHFISDHMTKFLHENDIEAFWKHYEGTFEKLPLRAQEEVEKHVMEGQYATGGEIISHNNEFYKKGGAIKPKEVYKVKAENDNKFAYAVFLYEGNYMVALTRDNWPNQYIDKHFTQESEAKAEADRLAKRLESDEYVNKIGKGEKVRIHKEGKYENMTGEIAKLNEDNTYVVKIDNGKGGHNYANFKRHELAEIKKHESGGLIDKKDSLLHYIQNFNSSGYVGSRLYDLGYLNGLQYAVIDKVKPAMIQLLIDEGDEQYSIVNLNRLIKRAALKALGEPSTEAKIPFGVEFAKGGQIGQSQASAKLRGKYVWLQNQNGVSTPLSQESFEESFLELQNNKNWELIREEADLKLFKRKADGYLLSFSLKEIYADGGAIQRFSDLEATSALETWHENTVKMVRGGITNADISYIKEELKLYGVTTNDYYIDKKEETLIVYTVRAKMRAIEALEHLTNNYSFEVNDFVTPQYKAVFKLRKVKTDKQIWDEWTQSQRTHFLSDYRHEFSSANIGNEGQASTYLTIDPRLSYNEMSPIVKMALREHIVTEGRSSYKEGGEIKKQGVYMPEVMEIAERSESFGTYTYGKTFEKWEKDFLQNTHTKYNKHNLLAAFELMQKIEKKAVDFYLDYVNNYTSVKAIAEHYNVSEKVAAVLIESGRKINENVSSFYNKGGKVIDHNVIKWQKIGDTVRSIKHAYSQNLKFNVRKYGSDGTYIVGVKFSSYPETYVQKIFPSYDEAVTDAEFRASGQYSKGGTVNSKKFGEVMHEFKNGLLKDQWGNVVKSRGQALAIAYAESKSAGERMEDGGKTQEERKVYMQGGTLERLKNTVKSKNFGFSLQHLNEKAAKTGSYAIEFIEYLVKNGVPLEQISTTDWVGAPIKVYIEIPFGLKGGGKYKTYQRFSDLEAKNALDFWKENSVKLEDGGAVSAFGTHIRNLSHVNPAKISVEYTKAMGKPDKLLLKYEGKLIASFYYNMKGYNQNFSLKNNDGIGYSFGGDKPESKQISEFKKAVKSAELFAPLKVL